MPAGVAAGGGDVGGEHEPGLRGVSGHDARTAGVAENRDPGSGRLRLVIDDPCGVQEFLECVDPLHTSRPGTPWARSSPPDRCAPRAGLSTVFARATICGVER